MKEREAMEQEESQRKERETEMCEGDMEPGNGTKDTREYDTEDRRHQEAKPRNGRREVKAVEEEERQGKGRK